MLVFEYTFSFLAFLQIWRLRCIYTAACHSSSLCSIKSITWLYHKVFFCWWTFGLVLVLAILDNAVVNILVHVSWYMSLISVGYLLEAEVLSHRESICLILVDSTKQVAKLCQFTLPPAVYNSTCYFMSFQKHRYVHSFIYLSIATFMLQWYRWLVPICIGTARLK